jgi:hypothetical protein
LWLLEGIGRKANPFAFLFYIFVTMKKERALFAVIILILCLLWIDTCNTAKVLRGDLQKSGIEVQQFKKKVLDDSSTIYNQELLILESEEQLKSVEADLDKMNIENTQLVFKLKSRSVFKTEAKLDKPMVEVTQEDPCPDFGSYLPLPARFAQSDRFYLFHGEVTKQATLKVDSLVMFTNITYAIGDTLRDGFFNKLLRKKDPTVSVLIDNPYVQVSGLSSFVIRDKKKWHQTTAAKIGAGIILGAVAVMVIQ